MPDFLDEKRAERISLMSKKTLSYFSGGKKAGPVIVLSGVCEHRARFLVEEYLARFYARRLTGAAKIICNGARFF